MRRRALLHSDERRGAGTSGTSVHPASIAWDVGRYSREHTWHFAGGAKLKASDSPFMLPEGYRDSARLDAEKLFVASVASSNMLYWLHIAFGMELDVTGYVISNCLA